MVCMCYCMCRLEIWQVSLKLWTRSMLVESGRLLETQLKSLTILILYLLHKQATLVRKRVSFVTQYLMKLKTIFCYFRHQFRTQWISRSNTKCHWRCTEHYWQRTWNEIMNLIKNCVKMSLLLIAASLHPHIPPDNIWWRSGWPGARWHYHFSWQQWCCADVR